VKFLRFWWDFLVGDDWVAALAVVVAIAITGLTGFWWFLPLAVAAVLYLSLRRAA
jgi:divalent metal cation (Fe/Co/Zn/Cd) transporter